MKNLEFLGKQSNNDHIPHQHLLIQNDYERRIE